MKFYKVYKKVLKWKEIGQINYKWNLPILIDNKYNVLVGNSLKDILPDEVIVVITNYNPTLEETLYYVENKVVEENSEDRFNVINYEIREYFKELRKPPIETISLFDEIKETRTINSEIYRMPPEDDYKGHGRNYDVEEDIQMYLWEEATEKQKEKTKKNKFDEIQIDTEIMKELL